MSRHEIRSYDYVNQPYARVKQTLVADPVEMFRSATRTADARARSLAAELRLKLPGVDVAAEITIVAGVPVEETAGLYNLPTLTLPISWRATHHPQFFPLMDATLSIYPLTSTETQIDFLGHYEPPLGALGQTVDALIGHRVAEAAVHRLVGELTRYLRTRLSES